MILFSKLVSRLSCNCMLKGMHVFREFRGLKSSQERLINIEIWASKKNPYSSQIHMLLNPDVTHKRRYTRDKGPMLKNVCIVRELWLQWWCIQNVRTACTVCDASVPHDLVCILQYNFTNESVFETDVNSPLLSLLHVNTSYGLIEQHTNWQLMWNNWE